jgi:hypothetical protein
MATSPFLIRATMTADRAKTARSLLEASSGKDDEQD